MAVLVKSINSLAYASVKTRNGLAVASISRMNGLDVTAGGFVPTDIAGCVLWLPADYIVGLSDGDPVSTWTDQSTAGNNATASGSIRPIYKTSILNSLPVVRFDGVNDTLDISSINSTGNGFTVFFVMKGVSTGRQDVLLGGDANYQIYIGTSGDGMGVYFTGQDRNDYPIPSTFSAFRVVEIRLTTAGDVFFYIDGALEHSGSGITNFPTWEWIASLAGFANPWAGDMAELVYYDNALSTGDRETVEDYLGAKYGITITH